MGNRIRQIFLIIMTIFLLNACSREEQQAETEYPSEKVADFSFRQFAEKINFTMQGETAEIEGGQQTTSVTRPDVSLETATETVEITTGREGTARIELDPAARTLKRVIIEHDVTVVYRDLATGDVTMTALCQKLTYISEREILIMEGSPRVKRGMSSFSGDIIEYNLETNLMEIKGDVNVQFYPESGINSD